MSGYWAFRFIVMLEYLCELITSIMGLSDRCAHASSVVRVFITTFAQFKCVVQKWGIPLAF